MKVSDDFELHPLLLEDLKRVHEELRANGELRSREALEGFYETFRQRFGPEELRAHDGELLLSLMQETTRDGVLDEVRRQGGRRHPRGRDHRRLRQTPAGPERSRVGAPARLGVSWAGWR